MHQHCLILARLLNTYQTYTTNGMTVIISGSAASPVKRSNKFSATIKLWTPSQVRQRVQWLWVSPSKLSLDCYTWITPCGSKDDAYVMDWYNSYMFNCFVDEQQHFINFPDTKTTYFFYHRWETAVVIVVFDSIVYYSWGLSQTVVYYSWWIAGVALHCTILVTSCSFLLNFYHFFEWSMWAFTIYCTAERSDYDR